MSNGEEAAARLAGTFYALHVGIVDTSVERINSREPHLTSEQILSADIGPGPSYVEYTTAQHHAALAERLRDEGVVLGENPRECAAEGLQRQREALLPALADDVAGAVRVVTGATADAHAQAITADDPPTAQRVYNSDVAAATAVLGDLAQRALPESDGELPGNVLAAAARAAETEQVFLTARVEHTAKAGPARPFRASGLGGGASPGARPGIPGRA